MEDEVGVRWWNPWEESAPQRKTLSVGDLDRRGKPVFRYRDIYMLYGRDGGRFAFVPGTAHPVLLKAAPGADLTALFARVRPAR